MYKMVIADDEQLIRESLVACIDWESHNVQVVGCCKNGIEALDTIIDTYPDLIITDIKMPGLTGIELIEKIHERDCDIEVIIITGHKEFEYARQAIRFGVTDFLLKPIDEKKLLEVVETAKKRHYEKMQVNSLLLIQRDVVANNESYGPITQLKKYVLENLSEPGLTLKWIANNVLYMNVDYLSRKFVTETGEKFSSYLMRVRMENAKLLLAKLGKDHLQEVASMVGCGNNTRYFSQLFKKYTGVSPTQYTF